MAYFEGNKMTGGYGNGPDIIHSCSVTVDRGEIVSILGPNGAGKSTAMKAMLGLLNLKSGTITKDEYRANIGYYEDENVDLKYAASDFHKRQGINYLRDKIVDWYPN